jgi:hypothetical protein
LVQGKVIRHGSSFSKGPLGCTPNGPFSSHKTGLKEN